MGDLEYAKNLLEELRLEAAPKDEALRVQLVKLRGDAADKPPEGDARAQFQELFLLVEQQQAIRRDIFHKWLSSIIARMGDGNPPIMDEWPLELFATYPLDDPIQAGRTVAIADILNHWQSRPLASGKTSQNGTTAAASNSQQSQPIPSSPPVPQQQ